MRLRAAVLHMTLYVRRVPTNMISVHVVSKAKKFGMLHIPHFVGVRGMEKPEE